MYDSYLLDHTLVLCCECIIDFIDVGESSFL